MKASDAFATFSNKFIASKFCFLETIKNNKKRYQKISISCCSDAAIKQTDWMALTAPLVSLRILLRQFLQTIHSLRLSVLYLLKLFKHSFSILFQTFLISFYNKQDFQVDYKFDLNKN